MSYSKLPTPRELKEDDRLRSNINEKIKKHEIIANQKFSSMPDRVSYDEYIKIQRHAEYCISELKNQLDNIDKMNEIIYGTATKVDDYLEIKHLTK